MLLALLILQLVQANEFVRLDVCFLDTGATPWEFRPHPDGDKFYVRADQIIYVAPITFRAEGIECVRSCSAHGCSFVIGTVASVMETIRGAGNAGKKERE